MLIIRRRDLPRQGRTVHQVGNFDPGFGAGQMRQDDARRDQATARPFASDRALRGRYVTSMVACMPSSKWLSISPESSSSVMLQNST